MELRFVLFQYFNAAILWSLSEQKDNQFSTNVENATEWKTILRWTNHRSVSYTEKHRNSTVDRWTNQHSVSSTEKYRNSTVDTQPVGYKNVQKNSPHRVKDRRRRTIKTKAKGRFDSSDDDKRTDIQENHDRKLSMGTKRMRYVYDPKQMKYGSSFYEACSNEYRIKQWLLRYYDKTTRPVQNDSSTIHVFIGMSLFHILDTNEKFQTLSALIAVRLRWLDEYIRWDPDDYGGLDQVWIPASQLWTPDIFIANFADDSFHDFLDTYAIVSYDGHVLWMFPAVSKTYCTLNVRHFPFDNQRCSIMFISWTFNGFKVNVTYNTSEPQAIYYTPENQEWYVNEVTVERNEKVYACCPEPYPDVTFSILMTRRSLFYMINLIFPCLLIYAVSFLGFYLPVESGEKINLETTILLALVVFLLMVGETLPPTPDAIPILGILFGVTMLMVSIALVMAVIVTNIYLHKDTGAPVPRCLKPLTRLMNKNGVRRKRHPKVSFADNCDKTCKMSDYEIDQTSVSSDVSRCSCHRVESCLSYVYNSSRCDDDQTQWSQAAAANFEENSQEWRKLAEVVDRIFFWLFVCASVILLLSLFLSVPHHNLT